VLGFGLPVDCFFSYGIRHKLLWPAKEEMGSYTNINSNFYLHLLTDLVNITAKQRA